MFLSSSLFRMGMSTDILIIFLHYRLRYDISLRKSVRSKKNLDAKSISDAVDEFLTKLIPEKCNGLKFEGCSTISVDVELQSSAKNHQRSVLSLLSAPKTINITIFQGKPAFFNTKRYASASRFFLSIAFSTPFFRQLHAKNRH